MAKRLAADLCAYIDRQMEKKTETKDGKFNKLKDTTLRKPKMKEPKPKRLPKQLKWKRATKCGERLMGEQRRQQDREGRRLSHVQLEVWEYHQTNTAATYIVAMDCLKKIRLLFV